MSNTPSTNPYKVAPLRGGQIDNDVSFTGGVPVLDKDKVFSSTTTTSTGPPSFMAIRTQNVSNMMKVESGAKQPPSTIFASANDAAFGLMTYIGLVHRHFIEYGMDTVFYFQTSDGTLVNILDGHSQFTKEEVHKQSSDLFKNRDDATKTLPLERYDMYDLQNLRFSAAFILGSISPALRAQVLTKAGKDYDNGPIVWMYVMGLVQSSSYRGTKILQKTFEERKVKNEPGENVIHHTIKLRDDYMRLYNANMVPYDALMTVIDSLIDSSTLTFAVWAATKRISVSRFLKDNAGKTTSALLLVTDAPTIESICDEADDEYQSLMESGLWVALNNKKDKDAAPTAFLIEKLTSKVNKLSATITKREGTCWTCGKEGHKSPECPTKNNHSSETVKKKGVDRKRNSSKFMATRPEWQRVKPKSGESETMIRKEKTWLWCGKCKHWSTTHGTSTHKGPPLPETKNTAPKDNDKSEDNQGNLAELVEENTNPCDLEIGAWCGYTTEPTDTTNSEDFNLGTWIPAISRNSKKKKNTLICSVCQSLYIISPETNYPTCHWCNPNTIAIQIVHDIADKLNGGSYHTDPTTGKGIWVPAANKAM